MPHSPGEKLGPYEIVGLIGEGGMGHVYKARDPRLGRDVAIKVVRQKFGLRFEREARAIAALNHPHICQIYDVGPNYLVMEYIEGAQPRGPIAPAEAVKLALGVAAGLEAAHDKGITHRDLKPANILVTSGPQPGVKLLDFGLALMKDAGVDDASEVTTVAGVTMAGTVLGTAAYMSPEQAMGKSVDARSDIFSFGLVFYELLSGRRAFSGDSSIEVMAAIVRDEPAPLEAPARLREVVSRCLRKSPDARFQTMKEVRAALEQADASPGEEMPSIAVLPFANMSADKENEYFSDGLAEEILNLLTKIPGLKVIARTSSFAFRGNEQGITKIAETLHVRSILEGSVRRSGSRIRVTAQLIHAADGSQLWSERYDREMTDVFAVQDEIGQAISDALRVRLAPRTQVVNVDAWQNYLKGRFHYFRYTPEGMAKAKECFEQALAIDPNYAPAYSGLAGFYYTLGVFGLKPARQVAPLAISAAEKALAADSANSDAHSVMGVMAGCFDYDWTAAGIHYHRAMATEPVAPLVRFRYACYYLLPLGRFPEAVEQSHLALEGDPLSVIQHFGMAWSLYFVRRYTEGIEWARRAIEIDAHFHMSWFVMGIAQMESGAIGDAIASLERVVELAPWYSGGAWLLAKAYHLGGDRERSDEVVRKLAGSRDDSFIAALYYAAVGETDAMFEALEEAYRQRDLALRYVGIQPGLEEWHEGPRFRGLLARMNLG